MSLRWTGSSGEEVAAPERHPVGIAAAVAPQVDDQRVGPADQFHRRGDRRARVLRHRHPAQVQVADVAVKALDAADAEVVHPSHLAHLQPSHLVVGRLVAPRVAPALALAGTARRAPWTAARARAAPGPAGPWAWPAAEPHRQVLVAAGLLQVAGEQVGERDLVQVVVFAGRKPRLDGGGDLPGQLGEHVVLAQQRQRLRHDLPAGQLLGGQRAVIGQADHGGIRRVRGELEQPGRRQPQGQLPAQFFHPLPVRGGPLGQVFRRGDKHSHR